MNCCLYRFKVTTFLCITNDLPYFCFLIIDTDDDLTRLIHQVYTEKNLDKERISAGSVVDEGHIGSSTYETKNELMELSDDTDRFNDDADSEGSVSDDAVAIHTSSKNNNSLVAEDIDNNETQETNVNQLQSEHIEFRNVNFKKKNQNDGESDSETDENINQLTSTILKSYLQQRGREHDDMKAFCWLWDFAGQKDFYATHQVFLSNCAVFLLVTDSLDFTNDDEPGIDFEDSASMFSK